MAYIMNLINLGICLLATDRLCSAASYFQSQLASNQIPHDSTLLKVKTQLIMSYSILVFKNVELDKIKFHIFHIKYICD